LDSTANRAIIHTSAKASAFHEELRGEQMKNRAILRNALVCVASLSCGVAAMAQDTAKHPITFQDMIRMHRVSEPQISPDGKWVAYTVATPDMDANRNASNIWMTPTAGGDSIQLTQSGHDSSPAWSPDGKTIAFLSSRDGNSQVYLLSMDGGEAHEFTHLSIGADIAKWSPDGKMIAFTSSVYPDCSDDACNKKKDEEKEKNKVKAHVAEHLLYRHWTHWNDGKRSHLFVVALDGDSVPRDLTPGADYDVPPD
jgi:dipeptidyl aminopeptidase/acylaminoacyl peptidase